MSYKLTDSDPENSEKASFISHDIEDRSDNTPKSPARNTLSMLLKSFGIFMLGAIFAMILVTSTDRFGRRRTYETGFAEERLGKIQNLHFVKSDKLIHRTQFLRQSFN
jgi:hypothetical protein